LVQGMSTAQQTIAAKKVQNTARAQYSFFRKVMAP